MKCPKCGKELNGDHLGGTAVCFNCSVIVNTTSGETAQLQFC